LFAHFESVKDGQRINVPERLEREYS